MPAYNQILNDRLSIADSFKQRLVILFREYTIWIRQEAFNLVRGKYYFERLVIRDAFSKTAGKLNSQILTVNDKFTQLFRKIFTETLTIVSDKISRIARTFLETIKIVATNPKQQYKEYSGSFSLTDSFAQNWFRECVETLTLSVNLLFGSTALTFKETLKILETFKQRLDAIVLREIIFINDFIKFGGRIKILLETIKPTDTIKRVFQLTKSEIISLADTFNKVAPTTFYEMFAIREQTWAIVNGIVYATFEEVIILGSSSIRQQAMTVLKEFMQVSDEFAKRVGKMFLLGIKLEQVFDIAKGKFFDETLSLIETFDRSMARTFEEVFLINTLFTRVQNILETIGISDAFNKTINPVFKETLVLIETFAKRVEKIFSEILSIVDDITKRFLKTISDMFTVVESKVVFLISKNLSQRFIIIQNFSVSLNGWVTGLWRRAEKSVSDWVRQDKDWK